MRLTRLVGAAVLVAAGVAVPATAAQAAVACDVTYRAVQWTEQPGVGGFQADITIENLGEPINGWTLAFTLPAGQSFRNGWSARWRGTTGPITASSLSWNANLATGQRTTIGFIGRWSGIRTDPTSFRLNGVICTGAPNQPPTVTLTSPTAGSFLPLGGTLRLAATANDPDGSVDRVEFFVGSTLIGSDDEAPFEVSVSTSLIGFGSFTAFARAFDDGSPPLSADSPRVPFTVVTVPPLSIVAEPTSLEVSEGGSATFLSRLSSPGANAVVTLTVAGASGVTVSPTSVTFSSDLLSQVITVTAAPGTAGSVATVTAAADPSQLIGSARVTVTVTG
jgi:cellulose 1,4-beta-cellobiosidase